MTELTYIESEDGKIVFLDTTPLKLSQPIVLEDGNVFESEDGVTIYSNEREPDNPILNQNKFLISESFKIINTTERSAAYWKL